MLVRVPAIACVLFASLAVAAGASSDNGNVQSAGLRLSLRVEKAAYAPYEPIIVLYTLENTSALEKSIPGLIDSQYGAIRLEISADKGPFKSYRTGIEALGFRVERTL